MGSELTQQLAHAYARAAGFDLAAKPTIPGRNFAEARGWIDSRLGYALSQMLPEGECRLEWIGDCCEGKAVQTDGCILFSPDGRPTSWPNVALECNVRFVDGVRKALCVGVVDGAVWLTSTPVRNERRHHKRVSGGDFAVVKLGNRFDAITLGDISEGGVGLQVPYIVEVGQHIDLLLRIEGKKNLTYECQGLVVNCGKPKQPDSTESWLGVQFTQIPDELRLDIQKRATDEEEE